MNLEVINPENGPVDLDLLARRIRYKLVQISHAAGTAHLGGALSCVDILVASYFKVLRLNPRQPQDPLRDRFIFSKGHAATALYTTLAIRGYFPLDWLEKIAQPGSPLAEQPAPHCAPGVELATGSLGHGLPVAVGMALAGRIQHQKYRVFVLMSDGECNEGSVWEAAMFAPAQKLDQLVVIVDYNKWQATGRSNEIMALPSLRDKFAAFGWDALEVDGHNHPELIAALQKVSAGVGTGQPIAIIAHTTKGKGISFMEDDNNWHYRQPTAEEVADAGRQLFPTQPA
jgi:transketolase